MRVLLCKLILAMTILVLPMAPAQAEDVVLTLTNQQGSEVNFTIEALEAMPATTFKTSTIWTEGTPEFTGVSLKYLLEENAITDGTLTATAANDYSVKIPASDAVEAGPIVAYETNGEKMSLRDKGPLWIVYPYDSSKEYQSEVIYSRSIWQLKSITATR